MMRILRRDLARVIAACMLAAIVGCSPIPDFGEASVTEVYDVGVDAAARGDYMVAIEAFKRITSEWPLDDLADDALVGLADAYREVGDYALAEAEYLRLRQDYPRSPLVADTEYKLGLVYLAQSRPAALDQATTLSAIDQFNRYLTRYPESAHAADARRYVAELRGRLAEKEFSSAELYMTLGNPAAARIYYEAVVADYSDTPVAPKALLGIVRSYLASGDIDGAMEARARLEKSYPGSGEAAEAAAQIAAQIAAQPSDGEIQPEE